MAKLFGKSFMPSAVAARVGRVDQVAGARPFVFDDGPGRGMRGIDVWTGSGLQFTVLPDRGMDIGAASVAGRAMAWQSNVGFVRPERYEPAGLGWIRSFGGGLVATCGLRHFGVPADDDGEAWGLHGRASSLSAEDVKIERGWEGGEYAIRVSGRIAETGVFKPALALDRTVATAMGAREFLITDRVTNVSFRDSTLMLLYHVNLGWPLLSQKSRFLVNPASVKPRTDHAAADLARHTEMLPPTAGFEEQVYLIEPRAGADGLCRAALVNPDLDGGTALEVAWPKAAMPYLTQWKMMGQGEYVLGIEPCNAPLLPRAELRERGLMPALGPGESLETGLTIRVHQGAAELRKLEKTIRSRR